MDKQGHGHHIRCEGGRYWGEDILEMLYELYTRIDRDDFR